MLTAQICPPPLNGSLWPTSSGQIIFSGSVGEEPTGGCCIFLLEVVCHSPGARSSQVSRGLMLAFLVLLALPLSPLLASPRSGGQVKPGLAEVPVVT